MRRLLVPLLLPLGGACTLEATNQDCERGADCVLPFVCCTAPRLPTVDRTPPYCEEMRICDAFMPFLVEGNPCGRRHAATAIEVKIQTCAEPLVCCARTLTCATTAACDAAPAPIEPDAGVAPPDGDGGAPVEPTACGADEDCPPGLVCCGIDLRVRDGACSSVPRCAAGGVTRYDPAAP
jgi:hypothetical protein